MFETEITLDTYQDLNYFKIFLKLLRFIGSNNSVINESSSKPVLDCE